MRKQEEASDIPERTLTLLSADGTVLARRSLSGGNAKPLVPARNGGIGLNLARISTNGQITVPAEIRRALMIKEGDKILFYQKPNGEITINNTSLVSIADADRANGSVYSKDDASERRSHVS